jgi:hypothetical protein
MGTNYYAHIDPCDKCRRSEENIHIGKMSAGWRFAVEVHSEFYTNWVEFREFISQDNVAIMANGEEISASELLEWIEARKDLEAHGYDSVRDGPVDLCSYAFS